MVRETTHGNVKVKNGVETADRKPAVLFATMQYGTGKNVVLSLETVATHLLRTANEPRRDIVLPNEGSAGSDWTRISFSRRESDDRLRIEIGDADTGTVSYLDPVDVDLMTQWLIETLREARMVTYYVQRPVLPGSPNRFTLLVTDNREQAKLRAISIANDYDEVWFVNERIGGHETVIGHAEPARGARWVDA